MDRSYSILIVPWRKTRTYRLVLSPVAIRYLIWGGFALFLATISLLGDYSWMKLERKEVRRLMAEAQAQRERLSILKERAQDIQGLFTNWRKLQGKVQASLPRQQKYSPNGSQVVVELESSLANLKSEVEGLIASIPTEWPVYADRVSSGVGPRPDPWTGEAEFHSGIDIPNSLGSPVHAPAEGVVDFAGENGGLGRLVVLNHGQGIITQYAHLSKILVKKGDRVQKNQPIAKVGNTGRSTNPHLHYEVRINGVPIDPRNHLLK